jgi:hypothetical protein
MRKEFGDAIDITLDVEPTTDSVAGGASRSSVAPALRLVMYRFALESVRALSVAGAETCAIQLRREGERLNLTISCGGVSAASFDREVLAPSVLATEAYSGTIALAGAAEGLTITLDVPAPEIEADPFVELDEGFGPLEAEDDLEADGPTLVAAEGDIGETEDDDVDESDDDATDAPTSIAPTATDVILAPRTGLAAAVEALQAEFFGSMIVALDVAPDVDDGSAPVAPEAHLAIEHVVRESLRALQAADARQCDLSLTRAGSQLMLSILSAVGDAAFDGSLIVAHQDTLERLQGYLAVDQRDGNVAVSAEVSASEAEVPSASQDETTDDPGAQHAA